MFASLLTVTVLLVLATVLPFSRAKVWWVRGWDFPRAQIAALAAIVVATLLFRGIEDARDTALLAAAALVCAYQLWWIWPFTVFHRRHVKAHRHDAPAQRVRIFAVNVLQSNRRAARLLAHIQAHQPDILLAVETDAWWQQQLDTMSEAFPHSLRCPLDNFYGMLLLSRWPLHDGKVQFLVEPDKPSIHVCVTPPAGGPIRLICLHPAPPSPTENEESTERDAELLIVARSLQRERRPTIVIGDLNDVAWSRTTRLFRKISGLLDPRIGRGLYNTFHARWPFARWPVDHLFHSRHFTLVELKRVPAFGSDHFPVFAELALNGGNAINEPPLRADAEDKHDARRESEKAERRERVHVPRSP